VLYEFVVVSILYFFIGAALAELASAIPSSAAGNFIGSRPAWSELNNNSLSLGFRHAWSSMG
jgi:hypothetical protein